MRQTGIFSVSYGVLECFQVFRIGMGQGAVKAADQRIEIFRMLRHLLHPEIALLHSLRHFPLTHICADNGVAFVNGLPDALQHLPVIRRAEINSSISIQDTV